MALYYKRFRLTFWLIDKGVVIVEVHLAWRSKTTGKATILSVYVVLNLCHMIPIHIGSFDNFSVLLEANARIGHVPVKDA